MTQKQKEDFRDWLTNNMQFTSVSRVQHVIDHVEHYFCPTPSPGDNQSLEEAAQKYGESKCYSCRLPKYSTGVHVHDAIEAAFLAGAAYGKGELDEAIAHVNTLGKMQSESMGWLVEKEKQLKALPDELRKANPYMHDGFYYGWDKAADKLKELLNQKEAK